MFILKGFLILATIGLTISSAEVAPVVKCSPAQMRIEVPITPKTKQVYIQGLRDYPDIACRPHTDQSGNVAVFELGLEDVYRCAVTRAVSAQMGKSIYYQTVVTENIEEGGHISKETLQVKCTIYSITNHTISKRNVLPAGFQEPDFKEMDILSNNQTIGRAPEPKLSVGVRQAGKLVTGELNVSPGTPLQMEIFLDETSSPIYGLLVTHMQVTDTKTQEETIIYNGCAVDPYLFENFNTTNGDFLTAKFKAFKFPESTYVQFKGTVNVCLDKCKGVECSDGQIGYGRRKRAVSELPPDPNKIFEISITSFIKVGSENGDPMTNEKTYNNKKLIVGNQLTELKEEEIILPDLPKQQILDLKEEEKYTSILAENSSTSKLAQVSVLFIALLNILFV